MQNAKEVPNPTGDKKTEWLDYIYDDRNKLVIPVGPRFQVEIPDWTDPQKEDKGKHKENESDTPKWLGTLVWPTDNNLGNKEVNKELTGEGRNERCPCAFPESVECVKSHVKEERMKLKSELGTAFDIWKFDEMGEEISNLWNPEEQKTFSSLVKTNRMTQGKSFLKPALASLPSKTRQNIVNYYFNVHVPQRISSQTRSGCKIIDTDDEEGDDQAPTPKASRKRNRSKKGASSSSKPAKRSYLTGRR
ncbi:PREDICTED: AT-rich interactive domain-containing protein 2-like [Nicotiana attenuata]|uniref:At-rich interactive domain-containing protein 2 n=1 Tax=Nicotiana attenuata TaxID=49451 RepID=A0A1J6IVE7_NICAT|nr:PREDICTED: AT-rich interactive domain-containing protein 2-like [Nicotiana attenuata]OIT02771.1 at-rich interactive domain-containing protein 2 [Nicotiana attenuata]